MPITEQPYDLQNFNNTIDPIKVLHAGDVWNGQPCISLSDDGVKISGSLDQTISVTDKFGVYLSGQISLSATPDKILIGGGYWTLNPLLLTCIPSTSPTPIPTLVPNIPPLLQSQSDIASICSSLESGLG
jgi:hypothetical protein